MLPGYPARMEKVSKPVDRHCCRKRTPKRNPAETENLASRLPYNDWAVSGRCKHQGMSWSSEGVLALAALEAAAENGELDAWRRDGVLPERKLSEPVRKAA
jgi:hypothetical protein